MEIKNKIIKLLINKNVILIQSNKKIIMNILI